MADADLPAHMRPGALVPGPDPGAAALLGGLRLRHPAALRHGGRRRHLPSGDHAARARAEAVERRLCAALAPAEGRPLRREPEPAAALLPVPGDPEAEPARPAGPLPASRSTPSASIRRCTTSASSRTTGRSRRSAPGGSAGSAGATAWRCRSSPTSSRSPASNARRSSGELTYGLERLAMYVQGVESVYDLNFNGREGAREGHLRRRVPAGRAGIFAAQFRALPTPTCCSSSSRWRRRPAGNISTPAGRPSGNDAAAT